jgi:hypothetical protein
MKSKISLPQGSSTDSVGLQRKDISKYIYKYFIEKDEKENFVKGIEKWEQKLGVASCLRKLSRRKIYHSLTCCL